jgi:hypothetical protein
LLLFGLKDLEQANAADALPLFDQFIKAKPGGKFAWIADLKPAAQRFLDDTRLYLAWKNQPLPEGSAAEAAEKLARVRDLKKNLKQHTALWDEINAQEKALATRVGDQRRVEDSARAQERKKSLDAELPGWNAALANYRQKIGLYDFAGARDAISAAKVSEPGLQEARTAAQKKAQWLIDWKTKLIDDLNRAHFVGTISDAGGAQYSGIDGATAQTIAMKIPYGSAQLPWTKLPPKTLLDVSRYFIKAPAPDIPDREWLSAVFAAETGQTEAARSLADAAVKAKPEYQASLSALFPGPPAAK